MPTVQELQLMSNRGWAGLSDGSVAQFLAGDPATGGMGISFLQGALGNSLLLQGPAATSGTATVHSPTLVLQAAWYHTTANTAQLKAQWQTTAIGGTDSLPLMNLLATVTISGTTTRIFWANTSQSTNDAGNTAFGFSALNVNSLGTSQGKSMTAFGQYALSSANNSLVSSSSAFGNGALQTVTSGGPNDAFGSGSLGLLTSGSGNAAFGAGTGQVITTGNYSTLGGYQAGGAMTTASSVTAWGYQAGASLTTNGGGVFLGYLAGNLETAANKLYISNSNSATPLIKGTFGGNAAAAIQFGDETHAWFTWNSQTGTSGVSAFTFVPGTAPSFASASGSSYNSVALGAYTLTLTGGVAVTALNGLQWNVSQPTVTSTSATTITTASAAYIAGAVIPTGAGPVTLTNSYGLHINNGTLAASAATTITTAASLFIGGAPAAGANVTITNGYAVQIAGGGLSLYATGSVWSIGNASGASTDTAYGYAALSAATGAYNTAVGYNASQKNTTGYDNVAVGYDALALTTTGNDNVAIGYQALLNNTTGHENVAVGSGALTTNTTSIDNVAVGLWALKTSNPSALQGGNTAVGSGAMLSSTTGTDNVAVGLNALYSNLAGTNNVAIGENAMQNGTTGGDNVAVGFDSLVAGNGNQCTVVGSHAAILLTASNNSAFGYGSLGACVTGTLNTAIGQLALQATTGSNNTALGENAGGSITSGSSNTTVGFQVASTILTTGSNNVLLGFSSATTTPSAGTNNFISIAQVIKGYSLANQATAVQLTDLTNAYYTMNTQTGTSGVAAHTFSVGTAVSITSAADTTYSLLAANAYTLTLTGGIAVTALGGLMGSIGSPTVTSASATTVTTASSIIINGPLPAGVGPVTFTNSFAMDLPTFATNGTTAANIRAAAPTGATNNFAFFASSGACGFAGAVGVGFSTVPTGSGVNIGASATANSIWNASQGAASTALYIGNSQITVSDRRIKGNIEAFSGSALDILRNAKLYTHDYSKDPTDRNPWGKDSPARGRYVSLMAQDVFQWAPFAVHSQGAHECSACLSGRDCKTHDWRFTPWRIEYDRLVPLAIKGIQELDEKVETVAEQLEKAKGRIAVLESRLSKYEQVR